MSRSSPTAPEGVPFSFFVSLLREISQVPTHRASSLSDRAGTAYPALQILRRWIIELRKRFSPIPQNTAAITFRLLFPEEDTHRKYDLQETRLARYLAECLGIQDQRLRNWAAQGFSGCLGEEVKYALDRVCTAEANISSMSIAHIDMLLDELASHSGFSHRSIHNQYSSEIRRPKHVILRTLYCSLSPMDASFLTQIILKDLRPLLYPLAQTHYTPALKQFNSASVKMLTKEHAMIAWDPSFRMLKTYRVRSNLNHAAIEFERSGISRGEVMPQVGIPIEVPRSEKGRGCGHALHFFSNSRSRQIWAETKYDGERAQIHVEVLDDNSSRITIFSKSKRDSTQDRYAVHDIIRGALGLPDCTRWPSGGKSKIKQNVVLDAEMVAYHSNHIDEFWRIRSLIEGSAHGIRGARRDAIAHPSDSQSTSSSQSSLASDSDIRHLALVFFDILVLDSTSLLSTPYYVRRSRLESLIIPIAGHAMLADRIAIEINAEKDNDMEQAKKHLRKHFAMTIADHQEGLVLKASEGLYHDFRVPWVKLKKDYIPGYGDSLDLVVLGAGWDRTRARELRVNPTTFTTMYVGALKNAEAVKTNPSLKPHFHIYFTVSYGLNRDQLEEINFLIRNSDPLPYQVSPIEGLSYIFTMFSGLKPPAVILRDPWLIELCGAGFTKAPKSQYYELRFPRITKIFRTEERHWNESVNLQELHKIARSAVGRDRPDKDIDDWCNDLWGKPVSPGLKCSLKRKANADVWEDKLTSLDHKTAKQEGTKNMAANLEVKKTRRSPEVKQSVVLQPLRTRTNVRQFSPASCSPSRPQDNTSLLIAKSSLKQRGAPVCPRNANHGCRPAQNKLSVQPENQARSRCISETMVIYEEPSNRTCSAGGELSPIAKFLGNALVWFARPRGVASPCLPWKKLVHPERQLHSMESLLMGCGWHEGTQLVWDGVERGVIFVDESEGAAGKEWKRYALEMMEERRTNIVAASTRKRKPIWLFDTRTFGGDIEREALYKLE